MTPHETLTACADLIERLADRATVGQWRAAEQTHGDPDARHVAAWDPETALLLVPVLRAEAEREHIRAEAVGFPVPPDPHLLAFAEHFLTKNGDN